jgi:hypothetical protein
MTGVLLGVMFLAAAGHSALVALIGMVALIFGFCSLAYGIREWIRGRNDEK